MSLRDDPPQRFSAKYVVYCESIVSEIVVDMCVIEPVRQSLTRQ